MQSIEKSLNSLLKNETRIESKSHVQNQHTSINENSFLYNEEKDNGLSDSFVYQLGENNN